MDRGDFSVSYWFPNTLIMCHLLSESPLRGPQNNWIQFMNSENVEAPDDSLWNKEEYYCACAVWAAWRHLSVGSRRDCTGWVRRSGYRAHLALSSNIMSVDYVCFYLLLYLLNCDIYNREVCSARVTIFWLPKTRTLGPETDTHDTRSLLQDALLISIWICMNRKLLYYKTQIQISFSDVMLLNMFY